MCQFKSGLILKDRVFIPDYDSHADMLEELCIPDSMSTPNFVKVEFLPPTKPNLAPSDYSNWIYKIDQDVLPEWYIDEIDRKRFIEEFKIYAKDNIAINQEITKKSKDYKVYINCTGSLENKTSIELIYNCNFIKITKCFINCFRFTSVLSPMESVMINNLYNCNIKYLYNSNIRYSNSNFYFKIMDSFLYISESDKIENLLYSCSNDMENGNVNYTTNSMVRYQTTDKNLKPETSCLNSIVINHNTKTNNHQIDFSIDREKETVSLKVKYNESDEW